MFNYCRLVVRRKSNKAFIRMVVKPKEDLEIGTQIVTGFTMQHVYTNTMLIMNNEPQKCDHKIKVFLNLGQLVGSQ